MILFYIKPKRINSSCAFLLLQTCLDKFTHLFRLPFLLNTASRTQTSSRLRVRDPQELCISMFDLQGNLMRYSISKSWDDKQDANESEVPSSFTQLLFYPFSTYCQQGFSHKRSKTAKKAVTSRLHTQYHVVLPFALVLNTQPLHTHLCSHPKGSTCLYIQIAHAMLPLQFT